MSLGLVGRKVGMMRIFTDDGDSIPVTVLDVSNNRVAQIKTPETDGYTAVQVAFGQRRECASGPERFTHIANGAFDAAFGEKRALQTVTKVDYKFSLSRIRSIH